MMWMFWTPVIMAWLLSRKAKHMDDVPFFEDDDYDDEESLELFVKLFDCPNCKMPAEVTHLMIIQEGIDVKQIYVAECLGEDDPFLISAEELDQIS